MAGQSTGSTVSRRVSRAIKRFSGDRRGSALVTVGIGLPVLLGVTALAVDLGLWYKVRRDYQTAADAGAVSAAWARLKGKTTGLFDVAKKGVERNGVTVGAMGASGASAQQDEDVVKAALSTLRQ